MARKPKAAIGSAMRASDPVGYAKVASRIKRKIRPKKVASPLKQFAAQKGDDGKYRIT